jgi:hypothetical protein
MHRRAPVGTASSACALSPLGLLGSVLSGRGAAVGVAVHSRARARAWRGCGGSGLAGFMSAALAVVGPTGSAAGGEPGEPAREPALAGAVRSAGSLHSHSQ